MVPGPACAASGRRCVDKAIRSALRETVFRFELVMRINVTVHELLEKEALIDAALSAHVALLTSGGTRGRADATPTYLERFATLRDLLLLRVSELHAAQEARAIVEGRYLDGHPALFPDAVTAWEEQVRSTEMLAAMACRLAELDGVPPPEPPDPEAVSARVTELVADLVEPAKSTALEKLGEGTQALGIATNWLRPKLVAVDPVPGPAHERAPLRHHVTIVPGSGGAQGASGDLLAQGAAPLRSVRPREISTGRQQDGPWWFVQRPSVLVASSGLLALLGCLLVRLRLLVLGHRGLLRAG